MNAVSVGDIDEMLALLTSGVDVNMILEVFYYSIYTVAIHSLVSFSLR